MALRRLLGRGAASVTPSVPGAPAGAEPGLPVDTSLVTDAPVVGGGGFDVVVTVREPVYRVGGHLGAVRAARDAGAANVVVSVYDVHAGPTSTYPPVVAGDHHVVARPTVAATWGGAVAAARSVLRAPVVVVQDADVALPDGALGRLVATVDPASVDAGADGREAVVAVPVVRSGADVVTSAGAVLVRGTAPVASLLRGHPAEDAARIDGVRVFGADEPCFAARTDALAVPVRTVDTRTAVARLTRDTADAADGDCVVLSLGRAYRTTPLRERRYDSDAADALLTWRERADDSAAQALARLGFAPAVGTADPAGAPVALREPVVRAERLQTSDRGTRLRWSIRIAAHPGPRGDDWGDTFFARDLANALRSLGQDVVVDHRESHVRPFSEHLDDVALTLRGLDDTPVHPTATNVLWVISHPDLVSPAELARYDLRFAAGPVWAARVAQDTGLPVAPLFQATDPDRFHPGPADPAFPGIDTAFVGKTRRVFRPVVRDAVQAGVDLAVWGEGWEGLLPDGVHRGVFVPNDQLPALYRSARVVLNDHWDDMARDGFVSNRLFDAAASGALVVTDPVPGAAELFHGAVRPYADVTELRALVRLGETATAEDRAARGARIGAEHSFTRRAETLLAAVRRERAARPER